MRYLRYILIAMVTGALVIGLGICLYLSAVRDLTSNETLLLNMLVTIFAIIVSWLLTDAYSKMNLETRTREVKNMHAENLRMYARKAAEKVTNLSNELERLSLYLEHEMENAEYDSMPKELQGKRQCLESAVHMIQTLKSVNDTSLSDWEGVIGDELQEKREDEREREEELTDIIARAETVLEEQAQSWAGGHESAEGVLKAVESLRFELRTAIDELAGGRIRFKAQRKKAKTEIEATCPKCETEIKYRQRPSPRSVKTVKCTSCGTMFISRFDAEVERFSLQRREKVREQIACPECGTMLALAIDNAPGASGVADCGSCGMNIRISRSADGLRVKGTVKPIPKTSCVDLKDDLIRVVKEKLPAQPWPKGVHKTVAGTLGVEPSRVARAISVLIQRGEVLPQIDGRVYAPMETHAPTHAAATGSQDKSAEESPDNELMPGSDSEE